MHYMVLGVQYILSILYLNKENLMWNKVNDNKFCATTVAVRDYECVRLQATFGNMRVINR